MNKKNDVLIHNERIYQKTVVAQAMERIKRLIASGVYKVGDKLPTEQELAEQFGIGRSSIREALKIFQYLGVLESQVPKGTFVCGRSQVSTEAITWSILLGNDDMWEIIELREIIEERSFAKLMKRFAEQKDRSVIEPLKEELEAMKVAAQVGSIDDLIQADYNFHAIIIREGGNKLFCAIYQTLYSFMREEIRKTYQAMQDLMDVYRDHSEILHVITEGDIAKAVVRHSSHFDRIKKLLIQAKGC